MGSGIPTFRYESVFALASLQFCGHIDEYLIANTRRLCLMYVLPRFGAQKQIIRQYEEGKLVEERALRSSQNIFLYAELKDGKISDMTRYIQFRNEKKR